MKKTILALSLVALLAACSGSETGTDEAVVSDSTVVDSTVVDSTVVDSVKTETKEVK